MATVVQKPDSLSLSGNLKKFILSSGTVITFQLKEGSTVLLDATYEPGDNGRVTIDLRDIIESRLSYLISHENFYTQPNIAKTFTAVIDGTETTFRAIRAGISNLNDTPTNWLSGNFLTWQPVNKQVTYYSTEWITCYATADCAMKLKAYFNDGTSQVKTLGTMAAGNAYTANVQYAVIAGLLGQLYPQHYEVYVENGFGTRLTYIQRYLYSEVKSEQEQWFLFENSLGGLDTIRASGDTDFTGEHEHKIAKSEDVSLEYDVDTERLYNKNTGYLNEYERKWLLDFFPSKAKYIYTAAALRSIVVSESNVEYSASDLPCSYTFKYAFSDASPFLNLIRNEELIPENIVIPDIDSTDFSLPPRLSEYPRVQLHEGVIFPVFDPHSEQPGITTFGRLIERMVQDVSIAVKDNRLSMRFEYSNGYVFGSTSFETTVTVHVFRGYDEITHTIPAANWDWSRSTTDPVDDAAWNAEHYNVRDTLTLRMNDHVNDFGPNIHRDRQCLFTVKVIVPDTNEVIQQTLRYAPF